MTTDGIKINVSSVTLPKLWRETHNHINNSNVSLYTRSEQGFDIFWRITMKTKTTWDTLNTRNCVPLVEVDILKEKFHTTRVVIIIMIIIVIMIIIMLYSQLSQNIYPWIWNENKLCLMYKNVY